LIDCSWKSNFGIDCLTCGFQRSFQALLQGEIVESFLIFPATIPLLIVFITLPIHLLFKFKHGARVIVLSFCVSAFLIVINYFAKLSDKSIFKQHSAEIHQKF